MKKVLSSVYTDEARSIHGSSHLWKWMQQHEILRILKNNGDNGNKQPLVMLRKHWQISRIFTNLVAPLLSFFMFGKTANKTPIEIQLRGRKTCLIHIMKCTHFSSMYVHRSHTLMSIYRVQFPLCTCSIYSFKQSCCKNANLPNQHYLHSER